MVVISESWIYEDFYQVFYGLSRIFVFFILLETVLFHVLFDIWVFEYNLIKYDDFLLRIDNVICLNIRFFSESFLEYISLNLVFMYFYHLFLISVTIKLVIYHLEKLNVSVSLLSICTFCWVVEYLYLFHQVRIYCTQGSNQLEY